MIAHTLKYQNTVRWNVQENVWSSDNPFMYCTIGRVCSHHIRLCLKNWFQSQWYCERNCIVSLERPQNPLLLTTRWTSVDSNNSGFPHKFRPEQITTYNLKSGCCQYLWGLLTPFKAKRLPCSSITRGQASNNIFYWTTLHRPNLLLLPPRPLCMIRAPPKPPP